MIDVLKEGLSSFGVPEEYHFYALVFALVLFLIGGTAIRYLYKLYNHWRKVDWTHIDAQVHWFEQREDGGWNMRWESVGRVHVYREIGGVLADKLVKAAKATTRDSMFVVVPSAEDHEQLMGQVVGLVGALSPLLIRSVQWCIPHWEGALFSEKYPGIPRRIKKFLAQRDDLVRLADDEEFRTSILQTGLESPEHKDRVESLLRMAHALDRSGTYTSNNIGAPRRVIRQVRGIRQPKAH